ncbi:MAG: hypothetical protein NT157_04695 [Candidatus Micrarchaeota archaeon]|nr:hypothetical protein [Candidatus Micrarchaeota archaeon]
MSKVAEKIIADAEKEAKAIMEEARKRAEEIKSSRKAVYEREASEITGKANERAFQIRAAAVAEAGMELRKRKVEEQQKEIDRVFADARARLARLELSEFLPENLPHGILYVAKKDVKEAKRLFHGEVKEAEISGGYILETGNVRMNKSLEALMEEARYALTGKVMEIIYEGKQLD